MKKNKKNIVLTFNLDNEYDKEIYNAIINLKGVGISRQGMIKRIFYYNLISRPKEETKEKPVENTGLKNFFDDLEK